MKTFKEYAQDAEARVALFVTAEEQHILHELASLGGDKLKALLALIEGPAPAAPVEAPVPAAPAATEPAPAPAAPAQ